MWEGSDTLRFGGEWECCAASASSRSRNPTTRRPHKALNSSRVSGLRLPAWSARRWSLILFGRDHIRGQKGHRRRGRWLSFTCLRSSWGLLKSLLQREQTCRPPRPTAQRRSLRLMTRGGCTSVADGMVTGPPVPKSGAWGMMLAGTQSQ